MYKVEWLNFILRDVDNVSKLPSEELDVFYEKYLGVFLIE